MTGYAAELAGEGARVIVRARQLATETWFRPHRGGDAATALARAAARPPQFVARRLFCLYVISRKARVSSFEARDTAEQRSPAMPSSEVGS
ncbi:MAG: hypothetical protein QM831_03525 [Kofleriaceae bacterium]